MTHQPDAEKHSVLYGATLTAKRCEEHRCEPCPILPAIEEVAVEVEPIEPMLGENDYVMADLLNLGYDINQLIEAIRLGIDPFGECGEAITEGERKKINIHLGILASRLKLLGAILDERYMRVQAGPSLTFN